MKAVIGPLRAVLAQEGSTRAIGLLRIAVATILLTRYGQEMVFFTIDDAVHAVLAGAFFVLVTLMLVGYYARAAVALTATLLAIMYFHFGFEVGRVGWNHHHAYLLMIAAVLLSFTPSGKSFSVDRYLEVRAAERAGRAPPRECGPLWATKLIVLQLSAIYFWSAVDKTSAVFLSGDRLEQIMIWHHAGRPLEAVLLAPVFLVSASVAVVAAEYFLSAAIHVARLFPATFVLGFGLHASFYLLLPVETFSVTMIALYLAALDPEKVSRAVDAVVGSGQ